MYSRNPARFGPIPKSYFNIELYKSEGQTLLDFWTVGYHTFPTREKNWKKNRTRYIEEGTADLLKLLNFSRLFHDCIYFVDKEVYKKFVKLQWMNFCHRRNLWFDVWVFFFWHRRETLEVTRPLKAGREGPSVQCTVSSNSGKQQLYSCSIQNTVVIWQEKNLVKIMQENWHFQIFWRDQIKLWKKKSNVINDPAVQD